MLPSNALAGTIPSTISLMSALTVLRLDGNALSGSIPIGLYQLMRLTELNVAANALTGGVAEAVLALSGLRCVIRCPCSQCQRL